MREKRVMPSLKAKAVCAILAGCLVSYAAKSQTYVPPSLPDNLLYSTGSGSTISNVNVASICYGNVQAPTTLMACVHYGNGNPGGLIVRDLGSLFTVVIPATISNPMIVPDVIIGNNMGSPLTDYIIATSYLNISSQPEIDYYKVHYTSPGVFTVGAAGSTIITTTAQNAVHIDVISETGNTTATGFPFCNKFVVTWSNGTRVFGMHSTLNAHPATLPGGTLIASGAIQPDVAGIERTVGSSVDSVALFAYTNTTTTMLSYIEWNFNTGLVSAPLVLDPGATSLVAPRIDAIDDYVLNSSPTVSKYKVVAQAAASSSSNEVRTYDNLLGSGHFTVSNVVAPPSYPPPGPYNSILPTVAYGSFNSTNYTVAHFSEDPSSLMYDLFMEPIQWMNPFSIANPPNRYYQVNLGSPLQGAPLSNAICTPANEWDRNTIVAWNAFSSGGYNLYYKVTTYPYAFRMGQAGTTGSISIRSVYPNPATDHITVSNADGSATAYTVFDITGRTVAHGTMQVGEQRINTSGFASGHYVLTLYNGSTPGDNVQFVKQ